MKRKHPNEHKCKQNWHNTKYQTKVTTELNQRHKNTEQLVATTNKQRCNELQGKY
jgi:hypothetical protein